MSPRMGAEKECLRSEKEHSGKRAWFSTLFTNLYYSTDPWSCPRCSHTNRHGASTVLYDK